MGAEVSPDSNVGNSEFSQQADDLCVSKCVWGRNDSTRMSQRRQGYLPRASKKPDAALMHEDAHGKRRNYSRSRFFE